MPVAEAHARGLHAARCCSRYQWELLVVNNNCTDGTDEVIRTFQDRLPVRRVFEPRPGLSHARNRAIAEATGDYILWTDDDVTVCRDWLVVYTDAFRRWPDAAVFGGPIQPWFDGTPPAWLRQVYPTIAGVYAARDSWNGADSVRAAARHPMGCQLRHPRQRAIQAPL